LSLNLPGHALDSPKQFRRRRRIHDQNSFADIFCEIADPFQIADDVKCADQLAQIDRKGLATRDRLDDPCLDLALPGINYAVDLGLACREIQVPIRQRRNRFLHRFPDLGCHIDDFRPNCAQIGVKGHHGMIRHWFYWTLLRDRAWMVF
jgi:hypothetical protein